MPRGHREYNFTTLRGSTGRKTTGDQYLEAKVERWLNVKSAEGWSLVEIVPVGEHCAHVVMSKRAE